MPIHQEIKFAASVETLFNTLIDSAIFAQVTEGAADIDSTPGGKFSLFGGMITGMTIEMIPNQLLIQAWRPANWTEGIYSIVRFKLEAIGDKQSKLVFEQVGHPEEFEQHLSDGWEQRYWAPMTEWFKSY